MIKFYLSLLVFFSLNLQAQIIPRPAAISQRPGLVITQIKTDKGFTPAIQKSLEGLTGVVFTSAEEANLEIKIKNPESFAPKFQMDESYTLRSTETKVIIEAGNQYGVLNALESLKQLLLVESGVPMSLVIKDAPRFPWRGLLIDVARNWISLETLRLQINLMAMVKLNVLHLHLSDDQAFRVESLVYPKLHSNNADKKFYTQKEIKDLISYAADRGIRVVPEFDVPGHTTSIIAAYPEIATLAGTLKPSEKYGPHDEAMNPINPQTYVFLEKLFSEMSVLFPDEFFHVGGDEVTGKHWLANPEIVKYMKENNLEDTTELQFVFTRKIEGIVQKLGKKMIAWDEVLKEKEALNSATLVWRGPKFATQSLDLMMPVIFSYGYYLDLQLSSEQHYSIDPAKEMNLTSDPKLLWGGEACMWSERITTESITHRIWPRAMAVAERLWSPRNVVDVQDFYKRQERLSSLVGLKDFDHDERISVAARRWQLPAETLDDFFSWLEPGKFYSQHRFRDITTKTAWNLWVDHMPSESLKATKLNWRYEKWIDSKDAKDLKDLEDAFKAWAQLSEKIQGTKAQYFSEKTELLALAKDMGSLSRVALDALAYLKSGDRPGGLWFKENQTKLGMLGQVRAGMRPAMLPMIERMVYRVAHKNAQLY